MQGQALFGLSVTAGAEADGRYNGSGPDKRPATDAGRPPPGELGETDVWSLLPTAEAGTDSEPALPFGLTTAAAREGMIGGRCPLLVLPPPALRAKRPLNGRL